MFTRFNKSLIPAALLLAASLGANAEGLRVGDLDTSITTLSSTLVAGPAPTPLLNLQLDSAHRLTLGMQVERLADGDNVDGEPVTHLAEFGLKVSF